MQISSIPQSEILATEGQNGQSGNTQNEKQGQSVTAPRPNWKANLISYKCEEKVHLSRECPHACNSTITESQQAPFVNTQQTSCAGSTLFSSNKHYTFTENNSHIPNYC